jgi:ParB-like chromosome segregation protein Spo0J
MARGTAFPPVFVIALGDELLLDDGCHRCTAAALLGETAVPAVVVRVSSREEADKVSELLFNLEDAGASWQERARIVGLSLTWSDKFAEVA